MRISRSCALALLWLGTCFAGGSSLEPTSQVLNSEDRIVAPDVIFSNLDTSPGNRYNSDSSDEMIVAGKSASETEQWIAIHFVPKTDAQATILMAAIRYESGTKRVNLGIYNDNGFGTVGTPIPGGQGTTTRIPDNDTCCQLTKVTLPLPGIALTAGTPYWLVASPDNVNGASFEGGWRASNQGTHSSIAPPADWNIHSGQWPAAEIRGTKSPNQSKSETAVADDTRYGLRAPARSSRIFSNLGAGPLDPYNAVFGSLVSGDEVPFQPEVWQALPFTPTMNSHATTLKAAIGWISGTRKVVLGVYTDSNETVGTALPGGEGSTTDIPDYGECCDLATVALPEPGVALTAGTQYWLVARSDDINAADFQGQWDHSTLAASAYQQPGFINWTSFSGNWLAAEIQGTSP